MAAMKNHKSENYSGPIIVELLQNANDARPSRAHIDEHYRNVIIASKGWLLNDSIKMFIITYNDLY
jgi:hypothetical protein